MLSYRLLQSETIGKWILFSPKKVMEMHIKNLKMSNNPMWSTAENLRVLENRESL